MLLYVKHRCTLKSKRFKPKTQAPPPPPPAAPSVPSSHPALRSDIESRLELLASQVSTLSELFTARLAAPQAVGDFLPASHAPSQAWPESDARWPHPVETAGYHQESQALGGSGREPDAPGSPPLRSGSVRWGFAGLRWPWFGFAVRLPFAGSAPTSTGPRWGIRTAPIRSCSGLLLCSASSRWRSGWVIRTCATSMVFVCSLQSWFMTFARRRGWCPIPLLHLVAVSNRGSIPPRLRLLSALLSRLPSGRCGRVRGRAAALHRRSKPLSAVLLRKIRSYAVNPSFSRLVGALAVGSKRWGSVTFAEMERLERLFRCQLEATSLSLWMMLESSPC